MIFSSVIAYFVVTLVNRLVMRHIFKNPDYEEPFERLGYVKVPFLSPEQIEFLLDFYHNNDTDTSGLRFHSTMFSKDPDYRRKVDKTIKDLTGDLTNQYLIDFKPLFANFITKEPGEASEVGLHQDWDFVDERHFDSVNYWCPLVDITEETGLFYVLEGSHRIFREIRMSPHNYIFTDLEDIIRRYAKPFTLKAGEAILYNNAVLHFSKPNLSNHIRIAIGSALIPNEAQGYHYYMDQEQTERKIEVFPAGPDFFVNFEMDKRPSHTDPVATIDYERIKITPEHLEQQLLQVNQTSRPL